MNTFTIYTQQQGVSYLEHMFFTVSIAARLLTVSLRLLRMEFSRSLISRKNWIWKKQTASLK